MKFAALLIVLVILGGVMVQKLATGKEQTIEPPKPTEPARSRIVVKQDLQAFTLLKDGKDGNLEARSGSAALGQTEPNVAELSGRYLLVNLKQGAEVKDEMVAPRDATPWLSDAVAVSIPVTATSFVGGQLRAGDLVELVAVRSRENAGMKKFEQVIVLNVVQGTKESNLPNAIALALPRTQRDDFASAVASAEVFVTRRIVVK
jgi:Flp pilus assembly protein CpaB